MTDDVKYTTLSKNTIFFGISSIGSKVIAFILLPIYTSNLSTDEYGTYELLVSTILLLVPLLSLNIRDAVFRFVLDRNISSSIVLSNGLLINVISFIVLFFLVSILRFVDLFHIDFQYYLFFVIDYFIVSNTQVLDQYLRAMNKVMISTIGSLAGGILTLGLAYILIVLGGIGVTGLIISVLAGESLTLLLFVVCGGILNRIVISGDILKKMLLYCFPLIVNSMAWWINTTSDKYVLATLSGISITGIYSVSYKIPTILSTIQNVIGDAWSITVVTEYEENKKSPFISKTLSTFCIVSFLACSFIMVFSNYLSKLLFSKDFYDARHYVPVLLIANVFYGIGLYEGGIFVAMKNTKGVSKTTVYGALGNIIFNIILIPFFGAYGAAIATFIGYLIVCLLRTNELKLMLNLQGSIRKIPLLLAILSLQAFFCSMDYSIIIQVLLFVMSIIVSKNELFSIINRLLKMIV